MDNRKLEFWLLVIVLGTFCIGTMALIIAKCKGAVIDPAIPLVDSTLGTLVMAMWKDFSHSNQTDGGNQNVSEDKVISKQPIKESTNPSV